MNKKKFYLSTAIAYTSSKPHIGNVYEAILADAIVRFKKKDGYDVRFQTGTDEHGQKIEGKAKANGISPKQYVDNISDEIKRIYKLMNVEYDKFVRTTDDYHVEEVQKVFEALYKKGDIYKGFYEGHYCVDCESYYTEKDLVDGCCPECGAKVKLTKEEAYFLKLAPYQERLVQHIKENPEYIQPESRKNEVLNNFLSNPIPDLCVSRTSFSWGIPVTFDEKHVVYVWIDALMNYLTGLGYHYDKPSDALCEKYWPADVHLIGKDILRFHAVYWSIMLMALGIDLPKQIFAHSWVLMNHLKMSKSKGNVIFADELVEFFGVDAVRYYVLHEIPFAQDGNITYELVCEKNNSDLANTLGNLVNRSIVMANKYFDGAVSYKGILLPVDKELSELASETVVNVKKLMNEFKIGDASETIIRLLRRANKYIDETEPWVLAKDDSKKEVLENVLYHLLETIRIAAVLFEPFIPNTSVEIYKQLNTTNTNFDSINVFASYPTFKTSAPSVLFKRFDVNKDILEPLAAKEALAEANKVEDKKEEAITSKEEITIDDFDKIELVVGQILEAKKHPKADKLLIFKVDIKSEVRQIVSGIAKFYNPDELIGKKVVIVKNLKPIKLRGEESCGMILCASDETDENLEVLNVNKLNAGDKVC